MEKSAESILEFTVEKTREVWEKAEKPYLLSQLGPDLIKGGINYKEILGEVGLKDFFKAHSDRVTFIQHPQKLAKIGLVPKGIEFEYPPEAPSSARYQKDLKDIDTHRAGASRRRYIVSQFLGLLAELDDEEAATVQIPTNILAKLLREK